MVVICCLLVRLKLSLVPLCGGCDEINNDTDRATRFFFSLDTTTERKRFWKYRSIAIRYFSTTLNITRLRESLDKYYHQCDFYETDCSYNNFHLEMRTRNDIRPFNRYESLDTDRKTCFESFCKRTFFFLRKLILNGFDKKKKKNYRQLYYKQ